MAVDPSWDNFTNKLIPVRRVNRLIVWNDLMKQQAVDFHGYAPAEVRVAGTPQWDLYFRKGTVAPREAFFRQIGADPARKLVTLTTTPRELYPHHDHVLRVLIEAMTTNAWREPAQVLVRLHPRDERDAYAEFEGVPHVIIEKPFRSTVRAGDGLAIDITSENQRHLANTMCHSDVVVNVASTLAIEAAIFDTPVVNVAFDGVEPSEWVRSARRYYRFTHYVNITRHGAVQVAEQPAQLVAQVGRYLDDPTLDRDGRARVVREQCQFLDGRAAERVADAALEAAHGARPRRSLASALAAGRPRPSLGQRAQGAIGVALGSRAAASLRARTDPARAAKAFGPEAVAAALARIDAAAESRLPTRVSFARHPLSGVALASVEVAPG